MTAAAMIDTHLDAGETRHVPGSRSDLEQRCETFEPIAAALEALHGVYCSDCRDMHLTPEGYALWRQARAELGLR